MNAAAMSAVTIAPMITTALLKIHIMILPTTTHILAAGAHLMTHILAADAAMTTHIIREARMTMAEEGATAATVIITPTTGEEIALAVDPARLLEKKEL